MRVDERKGFITTRYDTRQVGLMVSGEISYMAMHGLLADKAM